MNTGLTAFIKLAKHPIKFRMFLLSKLPSAFFSGLRIKAIDEQKCVVTIPYKWFTKNPFRSTYFACLSMAAEMSTGALAMANLFRRKPPVSMLVVRVESEYFKKASDLTFFTCEDGYLIRTAIDESVVSGEPRIIRAKSIGVNKDNERVAEFYITWSFRAKTKSI